MNELKEVAKPKFPFKVERGENGIPVPLSKEQQKSAEMKQYNKQNRQYKKWKAAGKTINLLVRKINKLEQTNLQLVVKLKEMGSVKKQIKLQEQLKKEEIKKAKAEAKIKELQTNK